MKQRLLCTFGIYRFQQNRKSILLIFIVLVNYYMEILEALEDELFMIPKSIDNKFLPKFMSVIYEKFLNKIDQITSGPGASKITIYKNSIECFCEGLINTAEIYFNGDAFKAYKSFDDSIKLIESFLFPDRSHVGKVLHPNHPAPYFRARTSESVSSCKERKDIFHVPFEYRNYASSQRFSILGVPCLYLSNSIYLCMKELNEKNFDEMPVSRFYMDESKFNFFDLTYDLRRLKMSLMIHKDPIMYDLLDITTFNFLLFWPLNIACSLKVENQNYSFRPDYIFHSC